MLLFYTVETLERERSTRLAAIAFATPIRTASLLLGKAVALAAVALAVVLAFRFRVDRDGNPAKSQRRALAIFSLLGAAPGPSILVWTGFVILLQTITQNRYTTYALRCRSVLYRLPRLPAKSTGSATGRSGAGQPSDISTLELDRTAIVLSRMLALGMTALFAAMTLRF